MKIERLNYLAREVSSDRLIAQSITSFEIYYFYNNQWHSLSQLPISPQLTSDLARTRSKGGHVHHPAKTEALFFVAGMDAVVHCQFATSPRTQTRDFIYLNLTNCAAHAENAFRAAFDELTELWNNHSLIEGLRSLLTSLSSSPPPDVAGGLTAKSHIGILAFDIDHFKRVNDLYGHPYGDIVLRAFGRRLESVAAKIQDDHPGDIVCNVARPHGEEFFVVLAGQLSPEDIRQEAERFRSSIGLEELPSDAEWKALEKAGHTHSVDFPARQERRITTSIGVTTISSSTSSENVPQIIAELLHRADLALYRAKAAGRNMVCYFPEILTRYGRVLEFHSDTSLVAIDLGSEVGVRKGQEFLVFHPKFAGSEPYVQRDGRSERKLGIYPRVPTARLEVFDVQKELSFCRILERYPPDAAVVPQACIEAVPLGSLRRLTALTGESGLLNSSGIPEAISGLVRNKIAPFVAVFRIEDENVVKEEVGEAGVNRALAHLDTLIRDTFPSTATIGRTSPTVFAVALPSGGESKDYISLVDRVIEDVNRKIQSQVRFTAGVFDPVEAEGDLVFWPDQKVDYSIALELADYASNAPREGTALHRSATSETILARLNYLKGSNNLDQALHDYRMLVSLGIKSEMLEHTGGQIAYAMQDLTLARDLFQRAGELSGTKENFNFANMAVTQFMLGDFQNAYNNLSRIRLSKTISFPDGYLPVLAMSAWHSYRDNPQGIPIAHVKELAQEAVKQDNFHFVKKEDLFALLIQLESVPNIVAHSG